MLAKIYNLQSRVKRRLMREISRLTLSGREVECNICGWQGRKFWQYPPRKVCPKCGAVERHRFLVYIFENQIDKSTFSGKHLLEFAPSRSTSAYLKTLFRTITTADIVPGRGDLVADICDINQIDDGDIDVVMAFHVLEHVKDDRKALKELHRVLRPGGSAILCVPICTEKTEELTEASPLEIKKLAGYPIHVRACGTDYVARIRDVGFDVKVFDPWDYAVASTDTFGICPVDPVDGAIFWCYKRVDL